ncbi:MAG: VRR-NUC domain-containing protein, partial [Candidatus Ozemobacteraceae bacterium]
GIQGFEAENRFWTSLFALVFWDILFLPVPRAFGHPFQWGPSDLFSAEFPLARQTAIHDCLVDLTSNETWRDRLLDLYHRKFGIANALITWEAIPFPILEEVVRLLPARHLGAICDRLSRNPGGFKTGFPDLFLFSPEPPGYLLAEVKSPNDRLQNNQRSWLRYFARHDIPCRVIQVEYLVP